MPKFQVKETDQYTDVGEEFESGDMCEALDTILRQHGLTVHEVGEEKEDTNDHITILHHDISYYLSDGSKIELGDCECEHIEYSIGQGYSEGELCRSYVGEDDRRQSDDFEDEIRGYWKIIKG